MMSSSTGAANYMVSAVHELYLFANKTGFTSLESPRYLKQLCNSAVRFLFPSKAPHKVYGYTFTFFSHFCKGKQSLHRNLDKREYLLIIFFTSC